MSDDSKKFTYVTNDGKEYTFDTEEKMLKFAIPHAFGGLVEKGLAELTTVDGEEGIKITDKGVQHIVELDAKNATRQ